MSFDPGQVLSKAGHGVWNGIKAVFGWLGSLAALVARVVLILLVVLVCLALVLAAPAGLVYWFLEVTEGGSIDAGEAFLGLAYIAAGVGVVAIGLLAALRLYAVLAADAKTRRRLLDAMPSLSLSRFERVFEQAYSGDQRIVVAQLRYGAGLIALGGTLAVVFGLTFDDDKGVALAIGTAIVGAGAALMPAGAAASASNRILQQLPDNSLGQPTVKTGGVSGATKDSLTVLAIAQPAGRNLDLQVEYGPDDKFGNKTNPVSVDLNQELVDQEVTMTSLAADTTYHYRTLASDDRGNSWRGEAKEGKTAAG